MIAKACPGLLLAPLLASCAASSQSDFAAEIRTHVRTGMPLEQASASLLAAGFECGENSLANDGSADLVCSREKSHRLLASCIQRVIVSAPPPARLVRAIEVLQPACAGL
ncbi:hypothetical protein JQK15_20020 [Sphingobium sp. BHU LFT2]|uniref:hypothetical protein n=1 Tax=Sphingobium sp. BHU LFT2 TaxID=2807634 RepID=UPI001BEC1C7A|nr:hypothetical protein [Sphingobium sp. BHU LFT2]MBT2245804.1 hypothetical protein [Sphingobium sp. BHU LFT2]